MSPKVGCIAADLMDFLSLLFFLFTKRLSSSILLKKRKSEREKKKKTDKVNKRTICRVFYKAMCQMVWKESGVLAVQPINIL